jgi:pSer/pThr/pTyr-binding forkhead associated (FHA) protein
MFGQLIPCGGGDPIPLLKPKLIVGRTPECDVTLPLGTVSSQHCLLELRDGVWHVRDLASRNGVRIDGVRSQEGRLVPGSILWIAQNRYQVDYVLKAAAVPEAQSAKPAPRLRESDTTMVEQPVPPQPPVRRVVARPGAAMGELIPCGGGAPIPLTKASLVIGRSPACDITVASPLVSSKHCQLEFKEGFWHVRDLGSRNGIRVDGIVQLAKYLKPGEILWIARHRYEISYTPLADEAPPEENPFALGLLEKAGLAGRGPGGQPPRLPRVQEEESPRKKWSLDENDVT